jgi:hypothetical protein
MTQENEDRSAPCAGCGKELGPEFALRSYGVATVRIGEGRRCSSDCVCLGARWCASCWDRHTEAIRRIEVRTRKLQAFRTRLSKKDMSPAARLLTLQAAKEAGVELTIEEQAELDGPSSDSLVTRVMGIATSIGVPEGVARKQTPSTAEYDGYPEGWLRCPGCGKPALDGHITCGDARCDEGSRR